MNQPALTGINSGPGTEHPLRATPETNSIFEEPWWMDCVAPGTWQALESRDHGRVVGRMVLPLSKRWGMTSARQPTLTQTLGPWVAPLHASTAKQLAFEKEVMFDLIGKMPPIDFFSLNFHRTVTNWLPFHWKGFSAAPKVTYVLPDLSDADALWKSLQGNVRTDIKKARKHVEVIESDDVEEFLRINKLTFSRQGLQPGHHDAVVKRLDAACAQRGKRRILFARDEQGRNHAAVYLVMDDRCTYYLMGGGDPALRNSGAGTLLVWEAMAAAHRESAVFDFEGSMGESIERFFRAFGPTQAAYLNVRKSNRPVSTMLALKDLMQAVRGR